MLLTILTIGRTERKALVRERWFWIHIICGMRSDCQGTWFSKDWYILLTVLQSVPFPLTLWLLVGRGHFDRRLSRFTAGGKAWIDEIVVVSAVASMHYPIENGSCPPFFLVWLGYMKSALQVFLTPNYNPHTFFSLILAYALFYFNQALSYGTFTHPNALFHAGAYIWLAFFTRISNYYQVWSLCIVYNASGCDGSLFGN